MFNLVGSYPECCTLSPILQVCALNVALISSEIPIHYTMCTTLPRVILYSSYGAFVLNKTYLTRGQH